MPAAARGRGGHHPPRGHDPGHHEPRQPAAIPGDRCPTGTVVERDRCDELIRAFRRERIDALVAVGGDGSLGIANALAKKGLRVVGVPKTIDNDLESTVITFGFDTAVSFATECIDRLHTTAASHRRVMVVEVMGRYAGWIALNAGVSANADAILIPEIPYDLEQGGRGHPRAGAAGPQVRHRGGGGGRHAPRGHGVGDRAPGGRGRPAGRARGRASPRSWASDRQGDAARRARPPAARRHAHHLRPAHLAALRRGRGARAGRRASRE